MSPEFTGIAGSVVDPTVNLTLLLAVEKLNGTPGSAGVPSPRLTVATPLR
jgi:hypothetical protein